MICGRQSSSGGSMLQDELSPCSQRFGDCGGRARSTGQLRTSDIRLRIKFDVDDERSRQGSENGARTRPRRRSPIKIRGRDDLHSESTGDALLPRRDQVAPRSRRRASEKDSCGDRAGPGDVEWKSTQSNKEFSTFPVFTKAPNRPRHVCVSNFHDVDSGSCGIGMSTLTGRLGLG